MAPWVPRSIDLSPPTTIPDRAADSVPTLAVTKA
jgi:hypothetical protein